MPTEEVFVVPRSSLFPDGPAPHGFFVPDFRQFLTVIREKGFFTPRPPAEENPDLKQIIPYLLLREDRPGPAKYFAYQRLKGGGEARLHAKVSLGVGGHINPADLHSLGKGHPPQASSLKPHPSIALRFETPWTSEEQARLIEAPPLQPAMVRELGEELALIGPVRCRLAGCLNDDSNPVGAVHLGLVVEALVPPQTLATLEPESHEALGFLGETDLRLLLPRMETWSVLALEGLSQPAKVSGHS